MIEGRRYWTLSEMSGMPGDAMSAAELGYSMSDVLSALRGAPLGDAFADSPQTDELLQKHLWPVLAGAPVEWSDGPEKPSGAPLAGRLYAAVEGTRARYEAVISAFEANRGRLLNELSSTTSFNDVPQTGAASSFSSGEYASNITKTVQETDVASRISSISKRVADWYAQWASEICRSVRLAEPV